MPMQGKKTQFRPEQASVVVIVNGKFNKPVQHWKVVAATLLLPTKMLATTVLILLTRPNVFLLLIQRSHY